MESQAKSESESCRVIVFGRDGADVLLKPAEGGFVCPSVQIPRWQRRAANLTAALKRDWGCDAVCLFTTRTPGRADSPNGIDYEVMECWHDEGRDPKTPWKPLSGLTTESFRDKEECQALEQSLREYGYYECDPFSPFARKGWLHKLRTWVNEIAQSRAIELTGPFCQYNASPSFSLIRFETTGPAVWFKAVGEPNQREFPITLKLAQLFPKYLPELLAMHSDWNGWLSWEASGTNLGDTEELGLWERAAAALANLQVESVGKTRSILDTGAHDLRVGRLSGRIRPFLSVVTQLMREQVKIPPYVLSPEEVGLLGERIADSLALLEGLGFPEVVGHSDLNPGNIIVSSDRCVFVDWAEAHVGHPFLSFEYLLEHFRRTATIRNIALEAQLTTAYSKPWRQLFSEKALSDALVLAPLAAVFAYAVANDAWQNPERLREIEIAGYFRSLARRMNREAIEVVVRRPLCLS